jgi:hypothetical protein
MVINSTNTAFCSSEMLPTVLVPTVVYYYYSINFINPLTFQFIIDVVWRYGVCVSDFVMAFSWNVCREIREYFITVDFYVCIMLTTLDILHRCHTLPLN